MLSLSTTLMIIFTLTLFRLGLSQTCAFGQYYNQYGNLSSSGCHDCPQHASCNGTDLLSVSDYWLRFGTDQTPYVQTYYCPLQRCKENDECSKNRKPYTENVMCGECEEGYSEWANICSESKTSIGLIVAFIIIIICFTFFFYFCSQVAIGVTRSFIYLMQLGLIVSELPESNLYGTQYLDFLFNFNLLAVFPASPIALSQIQRLWVRIVIPLLILAALTLQFLLHGFYNYLRKRFGDEEEHERPFRIPVYMYSRTLSNWVFFAYTPVTYGMFSALDCVSVSKLNSSGSKIDTSVNYFFPAVDCDNNAYKKTEYVLLYCVLPLTLLLPIVALIVLIMNDNRNRMQGANCKKYCGQWFEVYASRLHLFEILILVRRLTIVVLVTIFHTLNGTQFIIVVAICGAFLVFDLFLGPYEKDTPDEFVGVSGNYFQAFANLFLIAIALVRYIKSLPYSTGTSGEWLILAAMLYIATLIYLIWRVWLGQKQCRRCMVRQQSYEAGDENDVDD